MLNSFTEFRQAMGCRPAYVMRKYKKEGENIEDVGLEYWQEFRSEEEEWRNQLRHWMHSK